MRDRLCSIVATISRYCRIMFASSISKWRRSRYRSRRRLRPVRGFPVFPQTRDGRRSALEVFQERFAPLLGIYHGFRLSYAPWRVLLFQGVATSSSFLLVAFTAPGRLQACIVYSTPAIACPRLMRKPFGFRKGRLLCAASGYTIALWILLKSSLKKMLPARCLRGRSSDSLRAAG